MVQLKPDGDNLTVENNVFRITKLKKDNQGEYTCKYPCLRAKYVGGIIVKNGTLNHTKLWLLHALFVCAAMCSNSICLSNAHNLVNYPCQVEIVR